MVVASEPRASLHHLLRHTLSPSTRRCFRAGRRHHVPAPRHCLEHVYFLCELPLLLDDDSHTHDVTGDPLLNACRTCQLFGIYAPRFVLQGRVKKTSKTTHKGHSLLVNKAVKVKDKVCSIHYSCAWTKMSTEATRRYEGTDACEPSKHLQSYSQPPRPAITKEPSDYCNRAFLLCPPFSFVADTKSFRVLIASFNLSAI